MTEKAKGLAPCLAERGTQERKQSNSLITSNILHIQLSNFHELLSLLITQDVTIAESPSSVKVERPKGFAYGKTKYLPQ